MTRDQRPVAEQPRMDTVLPHLDLSRFREGLSPEHVTDGEVQAVFEQANAILGETGVRSTVNGIEALVSSEYAEAVLDGVPFYARVYRYTKRGRELGEISELELGQGLVFDEDKSLSVISSNPRVIRYEYRTDRPIIIYDDDQLSPRVNDPTDVAIIQTAQNNIVHKIEIGRATKQRLQTEAEERARAERETRNARRWRAVKDIGRKAIRGIAGATALTAIGFGVIAGGKKIADIEPYDYDLDPRVHVPVGGTPHTIGDPAATPDFDKVFLNDPILSRAKVPDMSTDEESESGDPYLGADNILRDVILTSSKEGKNCVTIELSDKVGIDSTLKSWTDFVDENGVSRADELSVEYNVGETEVCFIGEETSDEDDPRVILRVIANEPDTAPN